MMICAMARDAHATLSWAMSKFSSLAVKVVAVKENNDAAYRYLGRCQSRVASTTAPTRMV